MKVIAIILTSLVALLLLATPAAGGSGACTFSGTVYGYGGRVADGTLVTATVAGDEYYTYTSTSSGYPTYSLTINPPEGKNYPNGTEVTFKVNGHVTGQTAPFQAGENFRLDLAASAATTSSLWPTYMAIVALSILALLVVGAGAYRLLPRRRGLRIIDELKVTGNVPSEQLLVLATDGRGQVVSRDIGHNATLEGVENTGLLAGKSQIEQGETCAEEGNIPGLTSTEIPPQPEQDTLVDIENEETAAVDVEAEVTTLKDTGLLAIDSQTGQEETGAEVGNIPGSTSTEAPPQPEQDTSLDIENEETTIVGTEANVMTTKEAAQKLELDPSHVRRLPGNGQGKGKKVRDTSAVPNVDRKRKRGAKGKRRRPPL